VHEQGFELFGGAHLAALACVAVFAGACVVLARRLGHPNRRRLRLALGSALLLGVLAEWAGAAVQGWLTLADVGPLQLCDYTLVLAALTLLTLDRRTNEPLYFFALTGTLPALITPELSAPFPAFRFSIYFVLHGLGLAAALTSTFGLRLVPGRGAWLRAFLWLNVAAATSGLANRLLGTNFMYLSAKPSGPTPFDWLGPWPWYVLALEFVSLGLFLVLDLPLRRLRSREAQPARAA
jgi:hypothetical integral membrane protein (TIGR02206 family)